MESLQQRQQTWWVEKAFNEPEGQAIYTYSFLFIDAPPPKKTKFSLNIRRVLREHSYTYYYNS